mmetsp:Transcript_125673/g.246296  ORF Transcript_125673/g.246296 Transcript_125673/m.246296 type:complete len:83 (+) Transcript_125673:1263-1511(+)
MLNPATASALKVIMTKAKIFISKTKKWALSRSCTSDEQQTSLSFYSRYINGVDQFGSTQQHSEGDKRFVVRILRICDLLSRA